MSAFVHTFTPEQEAAWMRNPAAFIGDDPDVVLKHEAMQETPVSVSDGPAALQPSHSSPAPPPAFIEDSSYQTYTCVRCEKSWASGYTEESVISGLTIVSALCRKCGGKV